MLAPCDVGENNLRKGGPQICAKADVAIFVATESVVTDDHADLAESRVTTRLPRWRAAMSSSHSRSLFLAVTMSGGSLSRQRRQTVSRTSSSSFWYISWMCIGSPLRSRTLINCSARPRPRRSTASAGTPAVDALREPTFSPASAADTNLADLLR